MILDWILNRFKKKNNLAKTTLLGQLEKCQQQWCCISAKFPGYNHGIVVTQENAFIRLGKMTHLQYLHSSVTCVQEPESKCACVREVR